RERRRIPSRPRPTSSTSGAPGREPSTAHEHPPPPLCPGPVPPVVPPPPPPPPVPVCDPGRWHAVSHAAPVAFAEPSSHCSPGSSTPSPQLAFTQVVRQAAGVASLLLGPSSHASPGSTTPSPQLALTQVVRQAPGAVSLLFAPLSHCSPVSTLPSPQCDRVQFVLQAPGTMSLLLAPSSQSSPGSSVPLPQNGAQPMSFISAASIRRSWLMMYESVGSSIRLGRASGSQCDTVESGRIGLLAYMYTCPCASAPTRRVLSASSETLSPCASRAASSSLTPTTGMLTGNMAAWVRGSSRLDGGASPTASEKMIPMAPP